MISVQTNTVLSDNGKWVLKGYSLDDLISEVLIEDTVTGKLYEISIEHIRKGALLSNGEYAEFDTDELIYTSKLPKYILNKVKEIITTKREQAEEDVQNFINSELKCLKEIPEELVNDCLDKHGYIVKRHNSNFILIEFEGYEFLIGFAYGEWKVLKSNKTYLQEELMEALWTQEEGCEPLEVNWLESDIKEFGSDYCYCINRGSYIIADGLSENRANMKLDELCGLLNEPMGGC